DKTAKRLGLQVNQVDPAVLRGLQRYLWPGNVRELENVIERAMVMAGGRTIELEDLPPALQEAQAQTSPLLPDDGTLSIKEASRRLEGELIRRALEKTGGNRTQAARLLEISHPALLYKIKEYGLDTGAKE
ncbi:MAG TPA: helix-turn-helix domain-containing protein, partial [Syntrophobacteria bacterium]|nr:helix-turn-helix domain-containing protein [Syntrophobacteria bacterium]